MTSSPKPSNDFDPQARLIAEDGLSYANLAAYLKGEVEADTCNARIRAYREAGRSRAFCCEYRKGWEANTTAPSPYARGIYAFAEATRLQGEYHES